MQVSGVRIRHRSGRTGYFFENFCIAGRKTEKGLQEGLKFLFLARINFIRKKFSADYFMVLGRLS